MIIPNSEKSAEARYGMGDLAVDLADHYPNDRTDLVSVRDVNGCALDLLAADQAVCLSSFGRYGVISSLWKSI
jgi:hypothetical protein